MNCPDRNVLLAFQTGELTETTAEGVISHLSICPDCQTTLHALGDAEDTLVAKLRSPAVEDPYKDEPQQAELMARALAIVAGGLPVSDRPPTETPAAADFGRLGEYQLLSKLGEGGMGAVYKARQTRLKKIVALKVLPKDRTADPRAVTRFEREMEAVGQLTHPNIVQAHDARDIEGTTVLVMEYVDGKDLSHVVKQLGMLPVADACEIARQTALGLQAAHDHGLVHRDIKPSNLMLTCAGQIKILDLGLARLETEKPEGAELTSSGAAMGTADYMAPEQASDAHTADARADIYSLGCTLYKLLTGRAPFSGPKYPTEMKKMLAHISEPVPPVRGLRSDVPGALAAVMDRMLAKRPDDRHSTAAEIVAALAPFAAGCDLARLSAETAADGAVTMEQSSVGTDPHASSGAVGTDAGGSVKSFGLRTTPWFKKPRNLWIAVGGASLFAVVLLGVLIKMRTSEGTLIVELDDPNATVQVLNEKSEVVIDRKGEKGSVTIGVAPGKGRLRLVKDDVELFAQDFSLVSGGRETIKARLEKQGEESGQPPAPAIAPFDAKKAKEHQIAWAKYLGVPVEITNSIGMKLVLIPPGEYQMGSPKELIEEELKTPGIEGGYKDDLLSEGPQHRVRITKPFYLGAHKVTQDEFQRVTGKNPSEFSASGNRKDQVTGQDTKRFPVEMVSWQDADEFCSRLSEIPDEKSAVRRYRLPSEAQWEYACRAGTTGRWYFSVTPSVRVAPENKNEEEKVLSEYAWFSGNSGGMTHAVRGKRANAWGLYDIYGNVWEFCQDWYDKDYYAESPTDDPVGPREGARHVHRGGAWCVPMWRFGSAYRCREPGSGYRDCSMGLRVSLILPETAAERAKMIAALEAPQPSGASTANRPLPTIGSLIGPDGKWKLPSGDPGPAVAPFDEKKAKEFQERWAKYLGIPVELTNSIGMTLKFIPPGEFRMGSPKELIEEESKAAIDNKVYKDNLPNEGPQHLVRITKPFYLGMYVVTQDEYQRVMGYNPSSFCTHGNGRDTVAGQDTKRLPVECVSWDDAAEFCRKLSGMPEEKSAGRTYCLPSEAQWEYACRAGSTGRFSFSSGRNMILRENEEHEFLDYGWVQDNSGGMPHPVGGKRSCAWGLYDMHGNVWEWCEDWYDREYYAKSPADDPAGPPGGSYRVLRGGCWSDGTYNCRSACRNAGRRGDRAGFLGLRVSLVLPTKAPEPAAVPDEPIVPAKPVPLDLKPDAKAWDLKPGSPLNPASLVLKPAAIKGLRSWTVEICASRGYCGTGQLSPNDELYATGGPDGIIRILDPATGKLIGALVKPDLDLTAITWSPDSKYVAVGCAKGVVRIWNVKEGTLVIGPTSSSTNRISSLAWSPDGTLLAIARYGESAVTLWDVSEAKQSAVLQELVDANRSVYFLAWSADAKRLVVTTDLAVRIWDVAGARLIRTLDPQTPEDQDRRRAAAWSPDGKRIATLSNNGKVKVFDSTYKLVMSGDMGGQHYLLSCLAWSPDGRHLAGSGSGGCRVLNADNGLREFSFNGLENFFDATSGLSWSKDGVRLLCTHVNSGTVSAMDASSGKRLWQLAGKNPEDGCHTHVCISPDGRQYATAVCQDRLYTWDVMQGAPAHEFAPITCRYRVQSAWSSDGRLAAFGGGGDWWNDPGARIWDPKEPGVVRLFRDGSVGCAAWSPDGKTLARGGNDLLLWTSGSEDPRKVFHTDAWMQKLAWGPNNTTLAAGLWNNKVVILETPSGKVLKTLVREGLDGGIRCLAVLPDGRLVAASGNGAVSVWNSKWEPVGDLIRLKKTVRQGSDLVREEINVNDGAMPVAGTTIAFATSDGIVLWDADKQAIQGKMGTDPMYSVAWSLPLHRLIAAQYDRLAIYDVPSGELLASQVIWYGPGKHLFLSPEGHMRCSPAMSEDVVYVALTDDGRQVTLRQAEFEAKYGWKNDPEKIRLSAVAAEKPRGGKAAKAK